MVARSGSRCGSRLRGKRVLALGEGRGLLPGNTQKERCKNLWMRVQEFYDANQVGDRLQNLTIGMLRKKSGAPKLRSSAAACRALVPFLRSLLSQAGLLDATNNVHTAMRAAAVELNECYQALSSNSIFWEDILRVSSRKFAAQYVALERAHLGENVWRVKPKKCISSSSCAATARDRQCFGRTETRTSAAVVPHGLGDEAVF